ncbi:M14 family metallopeptidase [Variovorax sp. 350MFTsu5.1]|uniref:M14 family metallopeptidase n=1 Tax=Variovorax sp. 350MFTsu5.1 TaxID=3158365 RepID=UPI003AAB0A0E
MSGMSSLPLVLDHLPSGFMSASARTLHEVVPSPALIHLPGLQPRPVFVSVLLHGNEDVGLLALQSVLSRYEGRPLPRALSIFVGNVEAARAGVRRLEDQPDYNRIWPRSAPATPHQHMAARVMDAMREREVFLAIDLHNNSGRNPLYSCLSATGAEHLRLARMFSPLAVLIQAPQSLGAAFTPICPTVCCECGEIGNAQGVAQAAKLIERCLADDFGEGTAHDDAKALDIFQAFAMLKVAEGLTLSCDGEAADLQLPPEIESFNFQALEPGHVIATTLSHPDVEPLRAYRLDGEAMAGMLVRKGADVCLSTQAVAAMFTRDLRAIRQDCLGYLMQRVPAHAL